MAYSIAALGVQSLDLSAPHGFSLIDFNPGPGEGQVTAAIAFDEIPTDLQKVWVAMAQGNAPPADCSGGEVVAEFTAPFDDMTAVIDTGSFHGGPVSFRICSSDYAGN